MLGLPPKIYTAHQSLRRKVLKQVELVPGGPIVRSPPTLPAPPSPPATCFSHISGLCPPDFAHKVVPIPRQVCGVQGNEVIRGFAPFSLAPSQEEVLWVGSMAHQNQFLVSG